MKNLNRQFVIENQLGSDLPTLRFSRSLSVPFTQVNSEQKQEPKRRSMYPSPNKFSKIQHQADFIDPCERNKPSLKFQSSGFMIPSHNTKSTDPAESQDAMRVFQNVCGVADGVGQWKKFGINPRKFGENLLHKTCTFVQNNLNTSINVLQLGKHAMQYAFQKTEDPGSSTILIYYLKDNYLYVNYIGDSQLIILRPCYNQANNQIESISVLHKTKPQCFQFNSPYQLIRWPDQNQTDSLSPNKSKYIRTIQQRQRETPITPNQAMQLKIPVQENDIVVAGSDGIFDNIQIGNIIQILKQTLHKYPLQKIAEIITESAWQLSKLKNYASPFAEEAKKHNIQYNGGKADDCTVIVSQVILE